MSIRRTAALAALVLAASLTAGPAAGQRTPEPTGPGPAPAEGAGQAGAESPLFGNTPADPATARPKEPWELRQRLASVNWQVLRPLCDPAATDRPDTVTLNLFPQVTVVGEADEVGRTDRADSLSWRGEVQNAPDSSVTLTAVGLCDADPQRLALAGSVKFNGEEYTIRPRSGGRVIITEIDSTAAGLTQQPDEQPARDAGGEDPADANTPADATQPAETNGPADAQGPADGQGAANGGRQAGGLVPTDRKGRAVRPAGPVKLAAGDNSVIDVLVLYTPGAVKEAGGTEEIEAWIGDAASRANDNLSESGVKAEFRVVDMRQAPGYTGKETVMPAFRALTKARDGQLDEALPLRQASGADIVTTVVRGYNPKDGIAGLASYPENPKNPSTSDQMWSVVAANQLWAYVLAHEWGHLLGLDHDWKTSPEASTAYPDNHGYVAPDGSFTTIMGYPSACMPRPCPYTDYFANPKLKVDGRPLGVPLGRGAHPADNARVMNLTAPQVAAYRAPRGGSPSMDLRLSADPAGGGKVATETSGPYGQGDSVTVTADPARGHVFAGWKLDGRNAGKINPLTVTMNRDHRLVARFVKGAEPRYPFAAAGAPAQGGDIELKPGGKTFTVGTQVLAKAKARRGYEFAGWELDGSPAGDDEEFVIETSRAHSLIARFSRAVTLTKRASPVAGGKVVLSDDTGNANGVDIIAEAVPARDYVFSRWTLGGRRIGTDPVTSVTVNGNQTLIAYFIKKKTKQP